MSQTVNLCYFCTADQLKPIITYYISKTSLSIAGDATTETENPSQPQLKGRKRRIVEKMNGSAESYHHNNNNNNTTSGGSVKSERLSPGTPDTSSRSRSVTPSSASYPGTPPASEHGQNPAGPPPLAGRNYSDFMRSLAAKYNNNNPNE